MKSVISECFNSIIDLFYPKICCGCQDCAVPRTTLFCFDCAAALPYTRMEEFENNNFEKHFTGRIDIEAGMALLYYTKGSIVQAAIHSMKYKDLPWIGYELGQILGRKMKDHPVFSTCEGVVPIPLHLSKMRKRGYNQAGYIARGMADEMGVPSIEHAVGREKKTTTQTKRTRISRMKNMKGGFFVADPSSLRNKHILLVDDVLTTGATLDYCGHVIKSIPGTKLSMATLAMGAVV